MQNHMENKVYAGFFVRLVAFAIDSLIAALVVSTVKSPFTMAAASGVDFLKANFLFHYSFLDVLDYVAAAAYFILLTYFTHTTPGKMAMRLEVITIDREWTLLNVIYRETIGRFFSSLLCAGYFAVLVSEKKQGFHDMFCDTYVVYKGMVPQGRPVPVNSPVSADGILTTTNSPICENNTMSVDGTDVVDHTMLGNKLVGQENALVESDTECAGKDVAAINSVVENNPVAEHVAEYTNNQITEDISIMNDEVLQTQPAVTQPESIAPVYHTIPEQTDSSIK